MIYDRWGVLVYENSNNENSWDGYNSNAKKPAANGVYFYIVKAKNLHGVETTNKGYIQLFK